MAINVTSPVTGAAISGLTTPTYTVAADVAPNINGKQVAVTALGGTQTGVDVHTVSKPFTATFFRPAVLKPVVPANPVTGIAKSQPANVSKLVIRKGAVPLVNQAARTNSITVSFDIGAGTETFEPEEIKAMMSFFVGYMNQQAQGITDSLLTGVI